MRHIGYRKSYALGVIILLSLAAFGTINVPGRIGNVENEKTQEILDFNKSVKWSPIDYPIEKYSTVKINNFDAKVSAYSQDGRISRLYGEAFSYGNSPEASANLFLQNNSD